MTDHRAWQKETALRYRERKEAEARADGVGMHDHALDVLAANYVGATVSDVEGWRKGRA